MRDKHALAMEAIKVEQEILQEAVGAQDQVSAAYGGFNRIDFGTDGSVDVTRILTSGDRLAELEGNLALYFTGFTRFASEIAQEQLRQTPNKTRELSVMRGLVDQAEAIITNPSHPIGDFGRLLHEGWSIKRKLTQRITTSAIDEIYEAGLSAGALGGKLLGAGGGGFMLFFVPPERREALRERLKKLLCIPFKFSTRGSHVVVYEPEKLYDQTLASERNVIYGQEADSKPVGELSS
jgi:D-glycero-alpha-D-manno-heptose-7-phosphate kinase